jgi:hypothetical protein
VAIPTRKAFVDALVRAGFVSANDLKNITKIVITVDAKSSYPDDGIVIVIERVGDEALINALDEFEGK